MSVRTGKIITDPIWDWPVIDRPSWNMAIPRDQVDVVPMSPPSGLGLASWFDPVSVIPSPL